MEGIGYIGRIVSHNNITAVGPYVVQSVLLLVAPALFVRLSRLHISLDRFSILLKAASIYVVLGRLIRKLHAERFSLIRINWLTKFFVAGDVLSFLMQSSGEFTWLSWRSKTDYSQVGASWRRPRIKAMSILARPSLSSDWSSR